MSDLETAARVLLDEVDAYLDQESDADMTAKADQVRAELESGTLSVESVGALVAEANAHLDGEDDQDMEAAVAAVEEILGMSGAPRP